MDSLYSKKFFIVFLVLILFLVSTTGFGQTTFYSQGDGDFSSLFNWDDSPTGGGTDPIASELTDGNNIFVIQDGHTITLNMDINLSSLQIGEGGSATLIIGNNETPRNATLNGLTVFPNGKLNVGDFISTHTLNVSGTLENNGEIDLKFANYRVCNLVLDGTFDISGSGTVELNDIKFNSGAITVNMPLNIEGSLIIEDGADFNDGHLTHTIAGNWTENGNGERLGNGTIVFDGNSVQAITTRSVFHNLTINSGNLLIMNNNNNIDGDFLLTGNSELKTAYTHYFRGDFTVDNGSFIQATNGTFVFNASAETQNISIGTTNSESAANFHRLYFYYGGSSYPKNVSGKLWCNSTTYIETNAVLNGLTVENHQLRDFRIDGETNLQGAITIKGETLYDRNDNDFTINNNLIIEGNTSIEANDIMRIGGNLTINSGYLNIQDGCQLIGNAAKDMLVKDGTRLYIRGENNFPTGFNSITLQERSYCRYDRNGPQTINSDVSYGYLELYYDTKTTYGNLDINWNVFMYRGTFDMGSYNHTIAGHIVNNNSYDGVFLSTGTVTLDAENDNQYIYASDGGSYTFNNFNFTNSAPTTIRELRIYQDITVNGNFSVTNSGGDKDKYLRFYLYDNEIISSGGAFNLGAYVKLYTNGENNFANTIQTFDWMGGNINLDTNSTVCYYRHNANQNILALSNSLTYGNIELSGDGEKTVFGFFSYLDVDGDIIRTGNTPVLKNQNCEIFVAGDWKLHQNYTDMIKKVTFDGNNQTISNSNFNDVVFAGTGTKTILGDLNIEGDVTIKSNVTLLQNVNENIFLKGNWTEENNALFKQNNGQINFVGTTNQTISAQAGSYFYNFRIEKTGANKTVTALSDFKVKNYFNFIENSADFNLNGKTLSVADNWYFREGCTFSGGNGTIIFNATSDEQYIYNYDNSIVYPNLRFENQGRKVLDRDTFRVSGNFEIISSTVNAGGRHIYVGGNWTNTGTFRHGGHVIFNGTNQTIGTSQFHDVYIAGSGTKTLAGNIFLNGCLEIKDNVTLDVSTNNYTISIEEHWRNDSTGSFIPHQGTVIFVGNTSNVWTGKGNDPYDTDPDFLPAKTGAKDFYNIEVAQNDGQGIRLRGDLRVENNFIITTGSLWQSENLWNYGINDISVGGDFVNEGTYRNVANGAVIELNATSGNRRFNAGQSRLGHLVINADASVTYTVEDDFEMENNYDFELNNATFDLNHHEMQMRGNGGTLTLNSGIFEVDSAATLRIDNNATLYNNGADFKLLGSESASAGLTSRTGYFNYVQTGGSIHAKHYRIENTQGNGIEIQGGTINSTNNFSNGTFSSGNGNTYLEITDVDFGSGITVKGAEFNSGPSKNVTRLSGNGSITFENASGAFAGEAYDEDPVNIINWTYPGVYRWTGGGDGTSWDDSGNWASGTIPTNSSNVILDHSTVTTAYTVNINATEAFAGRLAMNSEGGTAITLKINGQTLSVNDNFTIGAGCILEQTQAEDTIYVGGSWSNSGTHTPGTATIVLNPINGTKALNNITGQKFYNLEINAVNATIALGNDIEIENNISFVKGTFDASSDYDIYVGGNWKMSGGSFEPKNSTVHFNKGGTTTQTIDGGSFHHIMFENNTGTGSATKLITSNISVSNDLTIEPNTVFDAGQYIVYLKDNWINNAGSAGFVQTGSGTVIINGNGAQDIDGLTTTFNNLIIDGRNTKYVNVNLNINGDLSVNTANLRIKDPYLITGVGDNSLVQTGATIYVEGSDNFPQSFENIALNNGYVYYYSDNDQNIYPTTYFRLQLGRQNEGNLSHKYVSDDLRIKSSLYCYDETQLHVNNHTITLTGGIDFRADTEQIEWGTDGTLIHNGGNWTIDGDIEYFNNLILSGTGQKRFLYRDMEFTGNLTVQNDCGIRQDDTIKITCTQPGKTFTLVGNAYYYVYTKASESKAFAMGFDNYNLDKTSRVYLRGTENQTIFTTPTYGNLYLYTNQPITQTLDGNLDVDGDFRMDYNALTLNDSGYNLNIAGDFEHRNYTPSADNTITFDGEDQSIFDYKADDGDGLVDFIFENVVFAGSGTKTITDRYDHIIIKKSYTINQGVEVYTNRIHTMEGASWINNGNFNQVRNFVEFSSNSAQSIQPGETHQFYGLRFSGSGLKTVQNDGLNSYNGIFEVLTGANLQLGSLTHRLATERPDIQGNWTTTNANFEFYRSGYQYLPVLNCNNIVFDNRNKYLEGNLTCNDLTINENTNLLASVNNQSVTPVYDITVYGNWTDNGRFYSYYNTVNFESNNTDSKTISVSTYGYFHNLNFNQSHTNSRIYNTVGDLEVLEILRVGNGASLNIGSQNIYLGNNDSDAPAAEQHYIDFGGELKVEKGGSLLFNTDDTGNPKLTVNGTLNIVGENGNYANIDRNGGGNYIDIIISSTGTIKAQYYHFQNISRDGLQVLNGATIDPVHNFSDGTWSDMYTGTGLGSCYYLKINNDVSSLPDIENVTFNFNGTPTQGVHFNVLRQETATGILTFAGDIRGSLAGDLYEDDAHEVTNGSPGKIIWPPVSAVTWNGSVSIDWFNPNNWTPAQVPDNTVDATIPLQTNNPVIYAANASCKNLIITNGFLTLDEAKSLTVANNVEVGNSNAVAILNVNNAASSIEVGGDWNRASNSVFNHGNGTVRFTKNIGTATINPNNSPFYNVVFMGDATFYWRGNHTYIDGDLIISAGTFSPNNNWYNLHLAGNYNNTGGEYYYNRAGTIHLEGADQTVTNGTFNRLEVTGTGTKTFEDSLYLHYGNGRLTVKSIMLAGTNCTMDINSYDVFIEAGATFNDGNQTHYFGGYRWYGEGNYSGNGTMVFDRNSWQHIYGGSFNNLTLLYSENTIEQDVDVKGNFTNKARFRTREHFLTNSTGTGTFTMEEGAIIYVEGTDNFPQGFNSYNIHENTSTYYEAFSNQTIKGNIAYGRMYLNNGTKTLGGNIDVNNNLIIYSNGVLDVSTNNYKINLSGHWYNRNGGEFLCREGEVVLDGNDSRNVYLTNGTVNDFYKLTVNLSAPGAYWRIRDEDISVKENLRILGGRFNAGGRTISVYGDFTAIGGTFDASGTYRLVKPSGSASIRMNGSTLNNLEIISAAEYTLQDNLELNGTFKLIAATFNGNGNEVRLGDHSDASEIAGVYKIGTGGKLTIGENSTFTVKNGGMFYAVGSENQPAVVTSFKNRYNFYVESGAIIHAKYHWFEFMGAGGIYIKDGALIDNENNFSEGVFTNCPSGGFALRIENGQSFTEALGNRIENLSFPVNPSNGSANIAKIENTSGTIEVYHSTGNFAGEQYDNDPNNLINWTGPSVLTWTGNVNSDWHNAGNWEASTGNNRIPAINDDVIINQATNQPIISSQGAKVKSIEMESGTYLTLNIQNTTDTTLKVLEDIEFRGTIMMQSEKDTIVVSGNWLNRGVFSGGKGSVILGPEEGFINLDNYTSMLSNLIIDGLGTVQLSRNTIIKNKLLIKNGELDIASNNRQLTVGGDFINNATFTPRGGLVILNSSTSGNKIFTPGNADYYYINIEAHNNAVYYLTNSNLSMSRSMNITSGALCLNGNDFYFGDANGTDIITVNGNLKVCPGSSLKMANSSKLIVENNGQLSLIGSGSDFSNITNQDNNGRYSININYGGLLSAKYYNISYIDKTGLWLKPGSNLDAANNLSEGNFYNGESNGRYLLMQNDLPVDYRIEFVDFGNGVQYNVNRPSGTNPVTFVDAFGLRGGYLFEDDDNSATAGNIRWEFTDPILYWTGNIDQKWDDLNNWDDGEGGTGVPNRLTRVFIPDVSATSGNFPVIGQSNADSRSVTIYTGAKLNLENNLNLKIRKNLENAGNVSVKENSKSEISVGKEWVCTGAFNSGSGSTVIFEASGGVVNISTNNSAFNNVQFKADAFAEYQIQDNFTTLKNLEIHTGTFTVANSANTISVGSTWLNTATYNHADNQIVFNGNNNQKIINSGNGSFYDVTFSGSGIKTLYSDISIDNNIVISSTLNAGNRTINLKGNWTNTGTFNYGTSTVNLNGTQMQVITNLSGENFYALSLNNTESTAPQILLDGSITLNGGNLTLNSGIMETSSANMLSMNGGNLIGGNSYNSYITGPMIKSGSSDFIFPIGKGSIFARIKVSGMLTTATFKAEFYEGTPPNTGSVTDGLTHVSGKEYWTLERLSGTGEPLITLFWEDGARSGIDNLSHLTVSSYSGLEWTDKGSVTTGNIISGNVRATVASNNFGYFTFGSLHVDYNPFSSGTQWLGILSEEWNNIGNWSNGVPNQLNNATITAGPENQPIITNEASCKSLTIHTGATLTVKPAYSLTAYGGTYNNGELRLKSPDNSGAPGSFIDNGIFGFGQYIAERFFSRVEWHYLSTPVNEGNASSELFTNPDGYFYNSNFLTYDETNTSNDWMNGWVKAFTNESTPNNLKVMRGYAFYSNAYHNIEFSGTFNTGEKTILTTRTDGAETDNHEGWNLVGNPYPSALDWDAAYGWDKQNIDNTIYFWNGNNYSYYVGSGGTAGIGINNGTNIIPAMQGFMVVANNNGHLRVNNKARIHDNATIYYKSAISEGMLKLSCTNGSAKEEMVVRFNEAATNEFDGSYDAYKMFANRSGVPQMYTYSKSGSTKMAVNTLKYIKENYEVAMGFTIPESGTYTIEVDKITINEKYPVLLEDLETNKMIDLRKENSYTFSYQAGSNNDRFILYFGNEPTGIEDLNNNAYAEIDIYSYKNTIKVQLSNTDDYSGKIYIYDVLGKLILQKQIQTDLTEIQLNNANGMYLVKLATNGTVKTKRLYIEE